MRLLQDVPAAKLTIVVPQNRLGDFARPRQRVIPKRTPDHTVSEGQRRMTNEVRIKVTLGLLRQIGPPVLTTCQHDLLASAGVGVAYKLRL